MRRTLMLFVVLGVVCPQSTDAQLVGIYADSAGTNCNLSVPFPGAPVDVYVVFTPGVMAGGLGGASFWIDHIPDGWTEEAFPHPDASWTWGSPFGWEGAQITFSSCQHGTVVLYRVRLTPSSAVMNHALELREGPNPAGVLCPRTFACPEQGSIPLPHAHGIINGMAACDPHLGGPHCPSVDALDVPAIESGLSISPNPPTTKVLIRYWLAPGTHSARLMVYDSRGRVIALLPASARAPAGSVFWDGRDRRGALVGAGVYIVRLQTNRSSATEKVVITR